MRRLVYWGILLLMCFWLLGTHVDILSEESFGYKNLEKAIPEFLEQYDTCETFVRVPIYNNAIEFSSWMRQFLVQKKLLHAKDTLVDSLVIQALKKFQNYNSLDPDGVVGPKTWAAFKIPGKTRYQKIIINMLRWKSDKQRDSCFIFINIPAYTLSVINNNKVDFKCKVIVGKPSWKTPVVISEITTVVINPYWYVPHSIAVKELVVDIKKDRSYLSRNNFKILNHQNRIVDAGKIDWAQVNAKNFNYVLRQEPGAGNSLGSVKFVFPSPFSIYLHDTPAKQLFDSHYRALSHGCIRLEKPMELLDYLHKNGFLQTSLDSIERLVKTKRNYYLQLKKTMPIYIGYFTCEADKQGDLYYYNDIYYMDENLRKMIFE